MGDLCSQNDLDRLLRSPEGKAHLEEIRAVLKGRTITDVSFCNEAHVISTTLHLDTVSPSGFGVGCVNRDEFEFAREIVRELEAEVVAVGGLELEGRGGFLDGFAERLLDLVVGGLERDSVGEVGLRQSRAMDTDGFQPACDKPETARPDPQLPD